MTQHRQFLHLAIPNILSNLAVPLAGIIDIALLGHLEDIAPLAGVALATIIFDYIYWSFGFLRMGTTGLTAKALGENNSIEGSAIFIRGFSIALIIGVSLFLLQSIIAPFSFTLLQGTPAVEAQGSTYFYARIWAAPATLGLYVINGWLIGMHKSRIVLLLAVLLNGLNIFFDWLFIYQYGMGAQGAGYATTISVFTTFIIGSLLITSHIRKSNLPSRAQLFASDKIIELFSLNGNLLIRTFFLITVFALFNNISSMMGTIVLAANTICLKIVNTGSYLIDGYAFSLEAIAGKFYGEKKGAQLRSILNLTLFYTLGTVLMLCTGIYISGEALYGLFASSEHHQSVISLGHSLNIFVMITLLSAGGAYVYDGFFIGIARGDILRQSMVFSTLIGFIPLAALSLFYQNTQLLWMGMILFMILRTVSLVLKSNSVIRCLSKQST